MRARSFLRLFFGFADDGVGCDPELHAREIFPGAAFGHVLDFFADASWRIAVHDEGVALLRDQFLGGFRFPARVNRWARLRYGLRLQHQILHGMIFSGIREVVLLPGCVHDIEPFGGAGVAVVMLIELHAVFFGFFGPPGGDDVERDAAVADLIDVSGLLGEQRGEMKRGTHGDH